MRYVISFWDHTTKRVPMETAKAFMQAQKSGEPIFYKGSSYSGKSIVSVRTLFGFYQDRLREAEESGCYFCKYGVLHTSRLDCGCKDAGREPMIQKDEILNLKEWSEENENEMLLLLSQKSDDRMLAMPDNT
jgi:hypothetical protein